MGDRWFVGFVAATPYVTSGATSDERLGIMTTLGFQFMFLWHISRFSRNPWHQKRPPNRTTQWRRVTRARCPCALHFRTGWMSMALTQSPGHPITWATDPSAAGASGARSCTVCTRSRMPRWPIGGTIPATSGDGGMVWLSWRNYYCYYC